jgi:hypothetical protein
LPLPEGGALARMVSALSDGAFGVASMAGFCDAPHSPQKAAPVGRGLPQLEQNVDCIERNLLYCEALFFL